VLKGALVGVGHVALQGHLPGWLEEERVQLVAAADTHRPRLDLVREQLPELRCYASAEELLAAEEELDFVDVCTPPASHADVVWLALQKGLHVLCEKPLVIRPEELPGLMELAEEKERVLFTVHNWKHAPLLSKVSEAVHQQRVGQVQKVSWQTLRSQPAIATGAAGENWRVDHNLSGGGILVDHGWHALYVLQEWLGVPKWIASSLATRKHKQWALEDTADVYLQYDGDVTAQVYLTWAADERRNRVEIAGSDGLMVAEGRSLSLNRGAHEERWGFPASISEGSHHPEWFQGVVRGFLAEIEGEASRENLSQAALCLKLLALAQVSSRTGGDWVAVDAAAAESQPA
jgi:predicted dehydrogenase